ncbi:MAG: hypothetical protein Q9191_000449 [Dirinaria sp. TL-2023a]
MTYAITGIKEGLGPGERVPLRREIDEWWFSKDENDLNQRSLFIYALEALMSMDPDDMFSYFGIAGIHGQPLIPWDTSAKKENDYCAHGETKFATWHRPYLLLYEQRLYEVMLDLIPGTFASSDQEAMFRAAKTWRLPYWDWAVKKPDWDPENPENPKNLEPKVGLNVPYLLTLQNVQVKTMSGYAIVPNPMWKFVLPLNQKSPEKATFGQYGITDHEGKEYTKCKATSRQPRPYKPKDSQGEADWISGAIQDWKKIYGNIRGADFQNANTLPEAVSRLFSYATSYTEFVTLGWQEGNPAKSYPSLEDVHDKLHGLIGGKGHMGNIAVAAFDPVFWLHHCNIDRLLAMWQDLYDSKYLQWLNGKDPGATAALAPFHMNDHGKLYDSASCSDQRQNLGYTYPDLQVWLEEYKTGGVFDKQKYQTKLRTAIELKYSTTGKFALQLPENERIATIHMSNMTAENLATEHFPPLLIQKAERIKVEHPEPIAPLQDIWYANDYVVDVVYDRFAIGGYPYHIRLFLGDVPPEGHSLSFGDTPTQVGHIYNFSGPMNARGATAEGCENCKAQYEKHALSAGQIVLTDYLVEDIIKERQQRGLTLASLSRSEVIEYLRKNLHWRITDQSDNIIAKEDPRMSALKISVAMGKATHYAEESRFSKYEDYEVLYQVTEHRLAGANPGDL